MSAVIDFFRKYVNIPSASVDMSQSKPSSPEQIRLAEILAEDMREIGIADAYSDALGYAYGTIPANAEGQPVIGLIAHLDVVDDAPCTPMHERIIKNYDGGVIRLNGSVFTDPEEYTVLKGCIGKDLIVTDGNTILGADDKAGVAEILAMAQRLINDPSIKHGTVKIAFTPDEEVGGSAVDLDIAKFGADFAYTVDGGGMGEIEFENFNAASAKVTVYGTLTHPGGGKNKMKNAALIGAEYARLLSEAETPMHTEGYEGFYHLLGINGKVDKTELVYILRDHDAEKLVRRKEFLGVCAAFINEKYGEGTCEVVARDSYRNMAEVIRRDMSVITRAAEAYRACGIEAVYPPVRGGTDGASLSWRGLPCPNLSTGGYIGHSVREFACVQDMETLVDVLTELVRAR